MNIYIVCAWYEVAMRHYSFTILNNIRKHLPENQQVYVTLVLRNDLENYPELKELEGLNIDYVIIKNSLLNILSKVFPVFFDRYVLRKAKEFNASLIYILFEGLFFKNIDAMARQSKIMYTVHDLIPHEKSIVSMKDRWLERTESTRAAYLREKADYRITNSYAQFLELKNKYSKPSFYTSMPTLVNTHIANGNLKPAEIKTGKYILFFGRLDKYKGLKRLIECHLKSAVDATLLIAGAGNIWFQVPDSQRVMIINRHIDDAELKYLFENALICVLPYISTTQTALVSIPFHFKCPVMLSDIKEFVLLANDSGSIVCDFNNYQQYNGYIKEITTNEDFRHSVVASQTRFYEKNYDPEIFMSHLTKIFDEIQGNIVN